MSKKLFAIFIIILIVLDNNKVYGQIEANSRKDGKNNGVVNQIIDVDSNTFAIDNNIYKKLENGGVMLWASNNDEIVVKDHISFNGTIIEVKYIYENAFENNSNIKNIIIENDVLGFCDSYGNPIIEVANVFNNKRKLTDVDIGKIESTFGERYFFYCKELKNLKISKGIKNIGGHAFERCSSLNSIDLSKVNKFDGESSFGFCTELNDIGEFNDELEELPARTFVECGKLKISNLNNIRKLGDECFKSCRQLDKDAVSNVEEIGERCFFNCNFSEVYLKEAKKICQKAFGGMQSLEKVRFGAHEIPFIAEDISMGSKVNEWIYPKDYINQEGYLLFLNKLKVSTVKWYPNYDNLDYIATQDVNLNIKTDRNMNKDKNKIKVPDIIRAGYEMEGWYKEPECIHKVNMIADLGEIIDSDIVIKNPELYAKWREKKENSSNQEEKKNEEEKSKPSDLPETQFEKEKDNPKNDEETTEEKNKPDEPKKEIENANDESKEFVEPINKEDKANNSGIDIENKENEKTISEKTTTEDISKENDSNKSIMEKEKKESKEKRKHKSKKRIVSNKNNNFSKTPINRISLKNDIKSIVILNNNDDKEVEIKNCEASSLDYKMTEDFVASIMGTDSELEVLNISYKDIANENMEISKSGTLGRIINDNECNSICLISNDHFEKNSVIEIRLKSNINLNKLYIYNKELCKYISANDMLEVQNNVIRIKAASNKEYLITKFELNKEDIAVKGWNKINNDWYYINSDGVLKNNAIIDGCKVGNDGKLI